MRNISSAFFRALLNDRRNYNSKLVITLVNGDVLNIDNTRIWDNGIQIQDAVSADNSFQIGSAIINQGTFILNNIYGDFSSYSFDNAKVVAYIGLDNLDDGTNEEIKLGTFIADIAEYNGSLINLKCLDNMHMFDKAYETNLTYPNSLEQIVLDACSKCGVPLDNSSLNFPHKNYIVTNKPSSENTTYRQVISWAAQIACCFARCNADGKLEIRWYDTSAFDEFMNHLYGGIFDNTSSGGWLGNYLNTEGGMASISSSEVDDRWFDIPNSAEIIFNGSVSDYIYISSNSCYAFTNTTPSGNNSGGLHDLNICTRDGKSSSIKYQEIEYSSKKVVKVRWKGYTRNNASVQSADCALEYELFFIECGIVVINFITIPSNAQYIGTSSIVENNVSVHFTPTTEHLICLCKYNGQWVSYDHVPHYVTGDVADGGSFNPWDTGYVFDSGTFSELGNIHYILSSYSSAISTDDILITGVKVVKKIRNDSSSESFEEYTSGTDGYVIVIENNDFIDGEHGQDIANWIGTEIIGLAFRKAEINHPNDPSIEAGDVAIYFDVHDNYYPIIISATDFTIGNSQRTVSSAETPAQKVSERYSAATRDYVELRKRLSKQKSEWEAAEEELSERIDNASGLYCTEVQQSGSTISYYHDKSLLSESNIVMMFSNVGFTMTSNYQSPNPTWYGMTVDGTMIAAILSAIGVNADWINAGSITLGGTVGNVNGSLVVKDSSGQTIISMNKDGATTTGLFMTYNPSNGYATRMNGGRLYFFYGEATYEEIKNETWDECYGMITSTTAATYNHRGILICTPLEYVVISKLGDDGSGNPIVGDKGYVANFVGIYGGYSERNIFYGPTRFTNAVRCGNGLDIINPSNPSSSYAIRWCAYANNDNYGYLGFFENNNRFEFNGRNVGNVGLYVQGNLSVGGTKNRIVETKHYGTVGMNAFETSSSHFADIGSGTVGEDGTVTIFFDPVFEETIDAKSEYQVFLTRTSEEETSWVEKKCGYFIVHGELGATFDWMIVGYQKNYVTNRMETIEPQKRLISDDPIVKEDTSAIDAVWKMVTHFNEQMEGLQNDD